MNWLKELKNKKSYKKHESIVQTTLRLIIIIHLKIIEQEIFKCEQEKYLNLENPGLFTQQI